MFDARKGRAQNEAAEATRRPPRDRGAAPAPGANYWRFLQGVLTPRQSVPASLEPVSSGGESLDASSQEWASGAFGADFSGVRLHRGAAATEAARDRGAAAFTMGNHIVLGQGAEDVQSPDGRRRLTHELVHVAQQGRQAIDPTRTEQADSPAEREAHDIAGRVARGEAAPAPRHAPSGIARDVGWASRGSIPDPYGMGYNTILTRAGAAAEPAVRDLASCEGQGMVLSRSRFEALAEARRRAVIDLAPHAAGTGCEAWFREMRSLHLATTMEGMAGQLYWAGGSRPDPTDSYQIRQTTTRPSSTAALGSTATETNTNAFAVWMRGGAQPGLSSKMNCWEAILFTAFRAGLVSEARLRQIHTNAAAAGAAGSSGAEYYRVIYAALGGPGSVLGSGTNPNRGDLVFFNFPDHVALALGSRTSAGEREVMSLWIFPPNATATSYVNTTQRTTIEALLRSMATYLGSTPTVRHASNPF